MVYRKFLDLVLSQGVANNLSVKFTQQSIERKKPQQKEKVEEEQVDDQQQQEEEQKVQRRGNRAGVAQRVQRIRRNQLDEDEEDDNQIQNIQDPNAMINDPDIKLSKKEMHKLQKKQEKERMAEGRRQQIEYQQKTREERELKEEEEEEKRKMEEELELENERKKKEEEAKKEQEEYNNWKDMFSVDETGDNQEEDSEYENKLQQFIEFIEIRKVILLEDLAAEFNMQTKDVVDRVQRLEETGRLSGITDDRGKYIHITEQEFESVSRYIKSKGRVNKAELLMECNKLIRMNPKNEDKAKIKKEQMALLQNVEKEFIKEEDKE